jgi:uncharacterized protein (TIGR02145 family)
MNFFIRKGWAPLFMAAVIVAFGLAGCEKYGSGNTFIDSRDGQKYRTVKIGNKVWMAENLNYQTGQSWCYGAVGSDCGEYGRLYDRGNAKYACPAGWHLPVHQDWKDLINRRGKALTSQASGWNTKNLTIYWPKSNLLERTDGLYGLWWMAATENLGVVACYRNKECDDISEAVLYEFNPETNEASRRRKDNFSVRCVHD